MIVYKLKCDLDHTFECWFQNSEAYDSQKIKELLSCPFCGSSFISKAPMAPRLSFQKEGTPTLPSESSISQKTTEAEIDITHAVKIENKKEKTPFLETRDTSSFLLSETKKSSQNLNPQEIRKALLNLKSYLQKNCEDVGHHFAEEARRIHYGETQNRNIYGQTTVEDLVDLYQEGIEVSALPPFPREDA